MTDLAPSWIAAPFDDPLDVDLSTEGTEWQHHLSTALSNLVSYQSFVASRKVMDLPGEEEPFEYIEYEARNSNLRSKLWVAVDDHSVLIAGDGPEDDAQVTPWVRAVVAAKQRMAEQHPVFHWAALIGPAPSDQYPGMGLRAPATVGPLELRPGGVAHVEYVRPSTPSLSGATIFQSWPVIVEGRASGYNWWPAHEAAVRDLNRLCALMTASLGRTWIIRQGPEVVKGDEAETVIPEYGPFEQHYGTTDLAHEDVGVPDWLDGAWDAATHDELTGDTLSAHYEGMLLKDAHPSIALLAFTSAIEAIGQTRLPTERCKCCSQVTKNAERFRQALMMVTSEEDATTLKKMAYGPRSKTVHAAKLHGREAVRGSLSRGGFFGIEPSYWFEIVTVRQLERISRELVQRLLRGDIT